MSDAGALPTITVVLPTLNAARHLEECLASVRDQDYPQDRIEILMPDGGSTDETLAIAGRFGARVLENPLKTGEAGKAVGMRAASGELILSLDSDNVLVGRDWLRRVAAPFADSEVAGAQAAVLDLRRQDPCITRYHALLGAADPLVIHLGNYDRYSTLTRRWTGLPHESEPRDGWLRVTLTPGLVPTLGANGFMFRRSALQTVDPGDYFFDIDFVDQLVERGARTYALVDVRIRHYFCAGTRQFIRKTRRRVDDFFYFRSTGSRTYPWTAGRLAGIARFTLATVLVVPLLIEAGIGFRRRPDTAWLFHPVACWVTLCIYAAGVVRGLTRPRMMSRRGWSQ